MNTGTGTRGGWALCSLMALDLALAVLRLCRRHDSVLPLLVIFNIRAFVNTKLGMVLVVGSC
ncbi:uncharacterized protein B0H64DRAFT_398296 [Chaetomium fimeti]|uniref:Uncharacterized protein n=1 Tax=Chaetomium fimeti TaxID=1854472 RepID=A0AAE0HH22_9PEZI|nr:hypothetical protein B0H64DRAFT_398296 [Chaetomium fimeti]